MGGWPAIRPVLAETEVLLDPAQVPKCVPGTGPGKVSRAALIRELFFDDWRVTGVMDLSPGIL